MGYLIFNLAEGRITQITILTIYIILMVIISFYLERKFNKKEKQLNNAIKTEGPSRK